jgi:hypothetical protein
MDAPYIYEQDVTWSGGTTCNCPTGNWEMDLADNCTLSTDCDLTGYNLTFGGNGTFLLNATLTLNEINNFTTGMRIDVTSNGKLYYGAT